MAGNSENDTQLNLAHTLGSIYRDILYQGAKQQVILAGGFESTLNTTTTPIGSGETYTGEWEQNEMSEVMVSCQTDNSGTLYFDFSPNGSDVNTFPVNGFKVASGIHEFHVAVKGPRHFRVRLVNDTGAQTYLRLYTYYGTFRQGNSPLNQAVSLDTDAIHVRPNDFQDEVRIGRRTGIAGWTKFAYRTGLTAAAGEETVWATTGNFSPMDTADTFTITYNSGTDGLGTTGALSLYFQYVDANGNESTAVHTLGNTGSDVTSFTGFGLNRVAVSSSGSAEVNTNAITITDTTGGTTQGIIPALKSVTQQAIFHTGANHDAVAKFIYVRCTKPGGGGNAKITVKGYIRNRLVATRYEIFETVIDTSISLTDQITDPVGFNLSPTDVLYFVANTDTNNVDISIRFSLNEYQRN